MWFQLDPFGKCGIVKDKDGNKYFVYVLNDVQRVVPIPSEELCDLIMLVLREKKEKSSKQKIGSIIDELRALASQVEGTEEVNTRYVICNNCLYINSGKGDRQIRISKKKKNGVECVKGRKNKFRSSKYIRELDYQHNAKADFDLFWEHAPVSNENDQLLLLAFMVNACFPNNEYPILLITGASGSGKTTLTEFILEIIDPTSFGVAAPLTSIEEIKLAAFHRHMPAFDNNGDVFKPNIQNLLCQSSTGGKSIARKFFTNNDAVVVDLRKPTIFNSLQSPFSQNDLLSRTVHLQLKPLTTADYAKKGGKTNLKNQFKTDLPKILKGFYEILHKVFVLIDQIKDPDTLFRMGDFTKVGIALEQVLGYEEGSFIEAYKNNLKQGSAAIIEDSDLAQAVISLARKLREAETFHLAEFITKLKGYSNSPNSIPGNSKAFKTELGSVEKALFEVHGIKIKHLNKSNAGARLRIIPPTDKSS
ncbi:MAG: hypothetical protein K2Y09_05160 [Nitrosomonas sp.]|uniref:hypothetical protein n=1 Tax=Nitrosomonas sp. TaxID=42353 RepID=UPI001D7FB31D|nr:hypothetical protein [Nitrosomonas sp.]MBX9894557.1 hypothetical protein [Nitrosomonas sp.]